MICCVQIDRKGVDLYHLYAHVAPVSHTDLPFPLPRPSPSRAFVYKRGRGSTGRLLAMAVVARNPKLDHQWFAC